MTLETYHHDGVCVIKPTGRRLDARVAVEFKNQLVAVIEQGHSSLLIDFGHVEFLDSSGLGAIVACLKKIGKAGDVRLSSLRPGVRSVLELTRLDKILTIYENEAAALEDGSR